MNLWINQKGTRPQDTPIDISELNAEELAIIKGQYPELMKNQSNTTIK